MRDRGGADTLQAAASQICEEGAPVICKLTADHPRMTRQQRALAARRATIMARMTGKAAA